MHYPRSFCRVGLIASIVLCLGAAQRDAGWRRERRQVGEGGAQVLEGLALQKEIVSDGEEDVHVGVEHESSQKLREALLHLD